VAEPIEIQPTDDSLVVFDGTILEVFAGSVSSRFHIKGIDDIQITEGWGRSVMIKNRFGTDVGISYDEERLPDIQAFVDQVLGSR
jgi:hypothetical protein